MRLAAVQHDLGERRRGKICMHLSAAGEQRVHRIRMRQGGHHGAEMVLLAHAVPLLGDHLQRIHLRRHHRGHRQLVVGAEIGQILRVSFVGDQYERR